MGLAARCILFLFSVSFLFLVFNLEILGGALHLAGRGREVDVAAVTHDVGSSFLSRFRMLIGLNHRRSRHRTHQRSSAAPAPAPTPYQEARSTAPAPLFHSPQKRTPSAHGSHIDPARSAEHKLGDGGHTRLPKATIVALAVVGACLLVLGVAIAAVSLRSHFSPKSPAFTASSHFNLHNTSHCPEKSDAQEIEVNHHECVKTNDNSGPMEHRNTPKEEEINFKFRNPPSENNSPSYHMDTSPSRTNIAFNASNTKVNLNSKVSSSSSSKGAKLQMPSAMSVPKSPPPPPPPKKPPPTLKGQNSGQPPLPPPLPLQIHVGKDGSPLPRLKPLHWDKVRAAPNCSMVWNNIRSSSFEFEPSER